MVIGWRGLPSQPNWSMSSPIVICPSTGMSTVCRLPSLGSSRMFPVMKITPKSPANHIHQGPWSADSGTSGYGPSSSAAIVVAANPTVNDTSDARNGVPNVPRSRALTTVCNGVTIPVSTPSAASSIWSPFVSATLYSRRRFRGGGQLCAGTRRFGLGGKACMASRVMRKDAGRCGKSGGYEQILSN